MSLLKDILLPNGATGKFYKIVRIETTQELDALRVQVGCWPSYDAYKSASGAIWNYYISLPIGDLINTIETTLVTMEPLQGANKIFDASPMETAVFLKWVEIKAKRDELEWAGFTWDGSTFDSDPTSQSRIQGAVILAMQDPQYQVTWTLANNTTRVLSNADILAVGLALATHVETLHARAQALRTQIDAAQNVAEVNAISW